MTGAIRPFRRGDRDQVAALVNAHAQAVVPGVSVSVNAVLGQLEREPGEFLVDPWVVERTTLVAEQRGRISAAAHLLRYGTSADVGPDLRDTGEIRWLLCWPDRPTCCERKPPCSTCWPQPSIPPTHGRSPPLPRRSPAGRCGRGCVTVTHRPPRLSSAYWP